MTTRRDRLAKAQNYAIYYGKDKSGELADYDLVIVEPSGQTQESLARLHANHCLVIAYLSVIEVHTGHPLVDWRDQMEPIRSRGVPVINQAFGNPLLDIRAGHWRELLLHQTGRFLLHDGYDGIFLDTIGHAENPVLLKENGETLYQGAVQFVRQLKETFPEHLIIQNNGLERLCLGTAPWIDSICWENPPFDRESNMLWAEEILKRLDEMKNEYGLRILMVVDDDTGLRGNYKSITIGRRISKQHDYLFYYAKGSYVGEVNGEL